MGKGDRNICWIKSGKLINRLSFCLTLRSCVTSSSLSFTSKPKSTAHAFDNETAKSKNKMGFWKLQAHDSCERANNSVSVLGKISSNHLMLCFIITNIKKFLFCYQLQALKGFIQDLIRITHWIKIDANDSRLTCNSRKEEYDSHLALFGDEDSPCVQVTWRKKHSIHSATQMFT